VTRICEKLPSFLLLEVSFAGSADPESAPFVVVGAGAAVKRQVAVATPAAAAVVAGVDDRQLTTD